MADWLYFDDGEEFQLLVFFACQARGVKFYDLAEVSANIGTVVDLRRDPYNSWDPNCVEVLVAADRRTKLGHIAKEAAKWLSPLLLGPYRITG